MADDKIYDEPSDVSAKDGVVDVRGPDGVDIHLTPGAADETSERLLHAALKARGQVLSEKKRRNGRDKDRP